MTDVLSALGDFTEAALGLAFSLGCALLLAFLCLRTLVGLMTRQQFCGPDNMELMLRARFALFFGSALLLARSPDAGIDSSGAAAQLAARTSSLLPRRATVSLELQNLTLLPSGGVVELPQPVAGRIAQGGLGDGWGEQATPPEVARACASRYPRMRAAALRGRSFRLGESANRNAAVEPAILRTGQTAH